MARLGDIVKISSSSKQLDGDKFWLLNLDMVEQQTGAIIDYNYVSGKDLNGSIIQFDVDTVLYSKLRPNLNKVVLPCMNGFATSEMLPLKPNISVICKEYLAAYLRSNSFVTWAVSKTSGAKMPRLGTKELLDKDIPLPSLNEQHHIAAVLDKVSDLISLRKQQLTKLDELVKARFVELFGDPITNSKRLPTERMELRFNLKAGITTAADDIHDFEKGRYEIPCYGGNGIRGYVKEKSYEGNFPIIGRQGALCGNVQYATGKFHATEHAVLVSLLKDDNEVWVYYLLKLMDLYRYHTGAAQPGLSVKTLNTVDVIVADKCLQNQFAAFVEQTDKSKVAVQKALDEAQLLFDSLMQKYFG